MNTTAAAVEKKEEKAEKRRALGRGLESLLPGPRVVGPAGASSLAQRTAAENAERPIVIQAVADESDGAAVPSYVSPDAEAGAAVPTYDGFTGEAEAEVPAFNETISISAQAEARMPGNLVVQIPVGQIAKNPYQTRYIFDKETLGELAESIRASGVVQPVLVRPAQEEGRYILILGERRLRASKMAGRETIPAIVRRVSEQQAAEMTIIENLQREDLNCMEHAEAFRVLSKQFNLTQEQIGKRIGMSRESVSNYMRLLKMPEKVMEYLATNQMTFSEARELLRLEDASKMEEAADAVMKERLTLEQIEAMVAKLNGWPDGTEQKQQGRGARWVDPNVRAAQADLERLLGVRVRIKDRKGKGKIVIEYHSVDDYDRVVGMLRGRT